MPNKNKHWIIKKKQTYFFGRRKTIQKSVLNIFFAVQNPNIASLFCDYSKTEFFPSNDVRNGIGLWKNQNKNIKLDKIHLSLDRNE